LPDLVVDIAEKRFARPDGSERPVLRDVHFVAPAGRFTCLFGPSGCGKTTLLQLVAGLDREVDGRIAGPEQARIGYVFQTARLLPWRTVRQNLRLVLADPDADWPAVEALLARMGLADVAGQYPGQLSVGQARRIGLLRGFAVRPEILLLDEPFASLDAPTAADLRSLLLELWAERPSTVLFVTHDLQEALALADRIVFLGGTPTGVAQTVDIDTPRGDRDVAALRRWLLAEHGGRLAGLL
jgi:NitT/TauT family transport system ATP-binding protein